MNGKRWTKKILKKSLNDYKPALAESYQHEADKKALAALKKIPFFDKICSKCLEIFNETPNRVFNMSSCVRVTEKQLPKIYKMVENACIKLGISIPDIYISLDRSPNAYTSGDKNPSIVIHSGLLETLEDDEIYCVIAHECGHIASGHVLYSTMGRLLLFGGELGLSLLDGGGLITKAITAPLKLAFFRWMRCSELTADRAAAICCEGSSVIVQTMMRLAGGTATIGDKLDEKLFLEQAQDYNSLTNDSLLSKAFELNMIYDSTHPLTAVRAKETYEWCLTDDFKNILKSTIS